MNKHNRREIEPVVASTAIVADTLLDDAHPRPPGSLSVTDVTFKGKPQAIAIDRDGDNKPDSSLQADITIFGNLGDLNYERGGSTGNTKISFKTNRDILGYANSIDIDRNGDGKPDAKMYLHKNFWLNVSKIGLDKDMDGKYDSTIRIRRGWFSGKMQSIDVDDDNDGNTDYSYKTRRAFLSGLLTGLRPY
jgi:hypothetical protein